MGSRIGIIKTAAKRIGTPFELYQHYISLGLKYCYDCKKWFGIESFHQDNSRTDGRKAKCKECCSTIQKGKISNYQRDYMRSLGFDYCRSCKLWLPKEQVRLGICKNHIKEEDRKRYANDLHYKLNRRQHSYSRKRNIDPIPAEAQISILEDFNGLCAYCDKQATTWDHVVPVSKGGRTTPGNVVPACISCNSSKNSKDVAEWLEEKVMYPRPAFFSRVILADAGLYG